MPTDETKEAIRGEPCAAAIVASALLAAVLICTPSFTSPHPDGEPERHARIKIIKPKKADPAVAQVADNRRSERPAEPDPDGF